MSARLQDDATELAGELAARGVTDVSVALVLGSGLGALAERLGDATVLGADELPSLPRSAVHGHAGRIACGTLGGVRVVLQQGRVHLYEGWSVREVTRAVRAFAALGAGAALLTNAAGSLVREWEPGTFMRIEDHLDLQGQGPVPAGRGCRGAVYDAELGEAADAAARSAGIPLARGVYAGLPGPAYETPAEIRALRLLGADAVGMSTVAEAAAARAAGLRVLGLSCLTNHAAGIHPEALSHEDVVATGRRVAARWGTLCEAIVRQIAPLLGPSDL